jgi:hypothetical protein
LLSYDVCLGYKDRNIFHINKNNLKIFGIFENIWYICYVKPFKFFKSPIVISTYGKEPIFADEEFYTMNKEEILSISGRVLPKYIIVKRHVSKKYQDKFRPDHEVLDYFKTREEAEFIRARLIHFDEYVVNRQ